MLSDVREQDEGVRFLRRVVDQHFTSPLLLVGPEGVGRRFSVIQATKEMFCSGTHEDKCGCYDCVQIDQRLHPDFLVVEPKDDKSEIGVDLVRGLIKELETRPTVAPYRVVLIDSADQITSEAENALLKTLEEPPPSVRFFLLSETQERVLPTIRSRCGVISFRSLSEPMVLSVLHRFVQDDTKALVYARLSEGSVGRALQYWGAGRLALRDKTFSLIRLAVEKDVAGLFSAIDSVEKELPQVLRFLTHLLHDLLIVRIDPARVINLDLNDDILQMSERVDPGKWQQLATGVRNFQELCQSISLGKSPPFHVKAIFALTFVGN